MIIASEEAFPDPAMQRAAQLVLSGNALGAIEAARATTAGINTIGPKRDTLLKLAVRQNDLTTVNALIAAGADPNIPSDRAPVAAASEIADTAIVLALLRAGANPDGAVDGETALWRAALTGRRDVAELLLKHGARVDLGNADGMTPAMAAVKADHYSMALYLLEQGASPFARSKGGTSLSEWAAESKVHPDSEEGQAREQLYAVLRHANAV